MTCTIYLQHETPDKKVSEKKDVYILIQKIINGNEICYVWFNLESESFDDSKTFKNEDEAKFDIFRSVYNAKDVCGDKVIGISFDYTKGVKEIKENEL